MESHADTPVAVVSGSALYRFFIDEAQMAHIRAQSIKRFWTWMLKNKFTNTANVAVVPEGKSSAIVGALMYEIWGDSQVREAVRAHGRQRYARGTTR